jgi:Holliday junction DNA helicase RuvA
MLAKLAGIIDSFETNAVIVMVGGMGVRVLAPQSTLRQIGQPGDPVALVTELVVREESLTLYGFQSAAELHWFRLLTSVQGVGPRSALSILTVCPPDRLQIAIAAQDKAPITQADGVGPKLAVRIITELKDKSMSALAVPTGGVTPATPAAKTAEQHPSEGAALQDAISALTNLGYGRSEAHEAVMRIAANDPGNDVSALIRAALKELGKRAVP